MGTQLSSLKVDATLNSSQWVQGANQIAAANEQAAKSANDLASSVDAVNSKLSSRQQIQGYAPAQQFQQQVDDANKSGHGFVSTLADMATIVGLAAKGLAFFATSGVAQMAALGGSFALAGTSFQNSFAKTVATGTADVLAAIALPLRGFAAVGAGILAMDAITKLGIEHMNELVGVAGKAQTAGVAPSFLQQQQKAAEDLTLSTDDATKALNNFFKATQPNSINGSALDQTLQTLEKAGNFVGNSGVAQYNAAVTTEQKWAAIVNLITQATQQGQRLAAIDLAKTFLPDSMLQKLEASGDFLKQLQQDAAEITPPFSDAEVAKAVEMNAALTDAENTIAEKWKPVMADLASLGMSWEQTWIEVVQLIAQASEAVPALYSRLKDAGSAIASVIHSIENAAAAAGNMFPDMSGTFLEPKGSQTPAFLDKINPLNTAIGQIGAGVSPDLTKNIASAVAQLAAGLKLPGATQTAQLHATAMEMALLGDTSKKTKEDTDDTRDAFDRLVTQLEKHTLANQADILSIGQSQAASAGLKAEFDLLEAAMVSNHGVTNDQIQSYVALRSTMDAHHAMVASGIKLNADDAASFDRTTAAIVATTQALEKVKADEQIKFQGGLLGLSDNDASIVQQLKSLYGDNIPAALNSSEAATLRMQKSISDLKGYATDFSSTLLSGLQQGQTIAESLGSALTSAANSFANNLGKTGTQNIVGGLLNGSLSQIGSGLTDFGIGTAISLITGSITADQQAEQQFAQAQQDWANMAKAVAEFVTAMMSEQPPENPTPSPAAAEVTDAIAEGAEIIDLAGRRRDERYRFRAAA
ncbi:MAG TPA: hypothetical protein VFA80_10350 [Xanthobacteraceae bacterium]|nr:hypothetical protein [Xanthobacteraceae bacterium]